MPAESVRVDIPISELIVKVKFLTGDAFEFASVATTENAEFETAVVGVPEITPALDRVKPAGKVAPPDKAHVNGATPVDPVTANVEVYAELAVPSDKVVVDTVGVAATVTTAVEEVVEEDVPLIVAVTKHV